MTKTVSLGSHICKIFDCLGIFASDLLTKGSCFVFGVEIKDFIGRSKVKNSAFLAILKLHSASKNETKQPN